MSDELHNRDLRAKDSHDLHSEDRRDLHSEDGRDLHSEDGRDLHSEDGICNAGSVSAGDCLFTVRPEITFQDYTAANRLVNGRLILAAGLYLAALLFLLGGVLLLFHAKYPGLFLCAAAALSPLLMRLLWHSLIRKGYRRNLSQWTEAPQYTFYSDHFESCRASGSVRYSYKDLCALESNQEIVVLVLKNRRICILKRNSQPEQQLEELLSVVRPQIASVPSHKSSLLPLILFLAASAMMAVFSGIAGLAPAGCILKPWLLRYVLADYVFFVFIAVLAVIQRVKEHRRKKRTGGTLADGATLAEEAAGAEDRSTQTGQSAPAGAGLSLSVRRRLILFVVLLFGAMIVLTLLRSSDNSMYQGLFVPQQIIQNPNGTYTRVLFYRDGGKNTESGISYTLYKDAGIFYLQELRPMSDLMDTDPGISRENWLKAEAQKQSAAYPDTGRQTSGGMPDNSSGTSDTALTDDSTDTAQSAENSSSGETDAGYDTGDPEEAFIDKGYQAIHDKYFQSDNFKKDYNAKGNSYVILKKDSGSLTYLIYDRDSENNKCGLYVLFETPVADDGSYSFTDATMQNTYAYDYSTGTIAASGKKDWSDTGSKEFQELAGEP
ncbi:MAG: hypothetical protein PUF49_06680 [Firmicutes bacterium]|nr:hypothetical protein [Bacillota bacterium]